MKSAPIGLIATVAAGFGLIGALRPEFLSSFNLFVLMQTVALSMLIGLAQMMVIALGQMNLSVGSIGGLVGIVFAGSMQVWHLPPSLALLVGMVLAAGAGWFNGWMTARAGLSAFVVTLATMAAFKGLDLGITQAQPFYGIPASVKAAGEASIVEPVPLLLLPAAIAACLLATLLNRLPIGRQILAVGGNPRAAELSGINVSRAVVWAHVLSGLLAGIAGMIAVARLQIGQPTIGDDWLIPSFAAPLLGGSLLSGGSVSVAGTICGVLIVTLITQALVLFRIDPYAVQFVLGALILAVVGTNRMRETRAAKPA